MNYFSMHLYGAEPQLLQMKAKDKVGAVEELKGIMEHVHFDEEDDDVVLFEMGSDGEGVGVFNYWEDYLREIREQEMEEAS